MPLIRAIARRYRVPDRTREDLVNDAVVYICQRWPEFDRKRGRLASWIGAMARNGIAEALRRDGSDVVRVTRGQRERAGGSVAPTRSLDAPRGEDGPLSGLLAARDLEAAALARDELDALASRLPPFRRRVLELRLTGVPNSEIAGHLGVGLRTIVRATGAIRGSRSDGEGQDAVRSDDAPPLEPLRATGAGVPA